MNIIVDTSVWSLALRRQKVASDEAKALSELINAGEKIWLPGIIFQEILQGVASSEQFTKLKAVLSGFPFLEPDQQNYQYAAELFNKCRKSGVQVTTIDCLIAAMAIQHNCLLFSADKDFQAMAKLVPLKLFALSK